MRAGKSIIIVVRGMKIARVAVIAKKVQLRQEI
jgi:hypothetical protein